MEDKIAKKDEPLLSQTLNRNCRYYNQPKQHEPLICQTLNSNNGRQHNNQNMNHSSVEP
jgi:hypothetical protein